MVSPPAGAYILSFTIYHVLPDLPGSQRPHVAWMNIWCMLNVLREGKLPGIVQLGECLRGVLNSRMWALIWYQNPGFDSPGSYILQLSGFPGVVQMSRRYYLFSWQKSVSPTRYIWTPKLAGAGYCSAGYCTYKSKCYRKEYLGHLCQSNTFLLRGWHLAALKNIQRNRVLCS
jgi:hypothetical protein